MKKSITAVIGIAVVIGLVILTAGCVGSQDQNQGQSAVQPGDETEIAKLIEDYIPQGQILLLGTASASGVPNVAPISAILTNGNRIILGNMYMLKTLSNIQENPQVTLLATDTEKGYCVQLKGTAEIKTNSDEHKLMNELVKKRFGEAAQTKNVVVVTVTEVYDSMLGPNAGQRIA